MLMSSFLCDVLFVFIHSYIDDFNESAFVMRIMFQVQHWFMILLFVPRSVQYIRVDPLKTRVRFSEFLR